jgi:ribosomal protein S12 methylthiotransferase accessory factor
VENIVFGFGAHLDAEIAAMRALTEINQVLPSAEAPGSIQRIAFYSREASSFINWLAEIRISEHSYLSPDQGRQRTYKEFDIWEGDSMHEVLVYCFERASSCGIEILALDQTRSDIGLSVVRVVAPGLRHFWKRWAPGRLYDVPVDMDLLHEKRSEYQLNPIPLSY